MVSIIGFLFSAALAVCIIAGGYLLKLKNDNFVEQLSEQVIKNQTGIDIDLSPEETDLEKPTKL